MDSWSPASWQKKPVSQLPPYPDDAALQAVLAELGRLPPLVTGWEVEALKRQIAEAQDGKRFLLQGGDCAESFQECRPDVITNKLKILLQMSLVLIHATKRPVVRVGRIAGQYAKPRSNASEQRGNASFPSYFGDMFNRPEFTASARALDPTLLRRAYDHAAVTLNYIRALTASGFADLHHPEYWDLSFFERADVSDALREQYKRTSRDIGEALRFMQAITQAKIDDLSRVEFFTSHEGLHLHYEAAQTRRAPPSDKTYCLSTHLPWIGERTRALDGAHVEYFRGISNPIGVKLSAKSSTDDVLRLLDALDPSNEPGRMVLITRFGADKARAGLPPLLAAVKKAGRRVLWVTDPMHGNTKSTPSGLKTRSFDDISKEIADSFAAHAEAGTTLGGVHFELTGEDVTECTGGGLSEADLDRNYASLCDPRLNYRQALEMAFRIAGSIAD
ncbi:MAG: 3-deoxy-7-phosphoheptulonate synthase [Deltaproteobacteria bacterium]|nr:3-deoxy-7-phosphoheptulonate synthase [Deltaproteobacteria bacterium]